MKTARLLLFFLALALVVQNTCPYGFAAKTGFAAPHTHACPLKASRHHGPAKERDTSGKATYPAFVVTVAEARPCIRRFHIDTNYTLFVPDIYKAPCKEPLHKPPAA
ncbi:MAG TPA: hypothetical protein VF790_13535 [Dissulfurispiraceae bacterium]